MINLSFTPCEDVARVLNALLDVYERRPPARAEANGSGRRAIRCSLAGLELPGYFSQVDPEPRLVANGQLLALEKTGLLRLDWLPGEKGHLLEAISLYGEQAESIFHLLGRTPVSGQRGRLEALLLSERFRFAGAAGDWRYRALQHVLAQLKQGKSPAPFLLGNEAFNQDLLTSLSALDELREETCYRVFSVRVFNDSKRFEALKNAVARLARLGQPEWRRMTTEEALREINLVANPGSIHLSGPWELIDEGGQVLSLDGYTPSIGLSAIQAARLQKVTVRAPAVLCIENLTTYYEAIRHSQASSGLGHTGPAAFLCLSGNPSPACRHLLRCLAEDLTEGVPLLVWADLDYGGMNILSQLRRSASLRFQPYQMNVETLESHAALARPLTAADAQNLRRLTRRPELADLRPVIEQMLRRGLKLEQEGITPPNHRGCSLFD